MRHRLAIAAALGAVLSLAAGAGAAPKACKLVTDPLNDNVVAGGTTLPAGSTDQVDDADLDLVSADIATSKTHATVVIRTRAQDGLSSAESPSGRAWDFFFTAGEQRYIFSAATGPDGYDGIVYRITTEVEEGGTRSYYGEGIGRARVVIDQARKEVRITAPLSYFTPYTALTRGRWLTDFSVWSYTHAGTGGAYHPLPAPEGWGVYYGSGGVAHSSDSAMSDARYNPGAPSCVAVGK
jgi:hypothetical protein